MTTVPQSPARPDLEFVFSIEAAIDKARSGGPVAGGERLHIPIVDGRVSGPKLSGRILPGGSDWPLVRADSSTRIDARYTIETDDGTYILVTNTGVRSSSDAVFDRMRRGEVVSPDEYYFRSTPIFEAPTGPHDWLNRHVFVASIAPQGKIIVVDVFRVS